MSIKASNNPFPHDPDDNWKEKLDRGGYPGTAKDLFDKISQIDAPDGILIAGEITRIGNVFSIGASTFTCRIKQQELVNQDDFSTTIVNASDNYKRIDILVFTKFSTIIKIQGDEDLVSAKEPDVPTGTIKLAFFSIFGNQVDEHNEPIIIPDISEKLDRGGFEGTAQDIVNAIPDPSEFWRKLDKDGYDGTAKTLKDEIDSGLLLKENKANKANDFGIVNDQLYPTVKASKTYIDNGLSLKENLSNKAVNFDIINDILYPTVKNVKTQLDTKISVSEKGAANGVGTLDANGKAPLSQMNDALLGNVKYKGLYNGVVISSSPDVLLNGTALPAPSSTNTGWYFIASVPFTNSGKDYANGDWIISNGVIWDRVDNTDAVSTVFGRVGHITAQNGDYTTGLVTEVSNKNYQTDNQKLFNDATSSIQNQLNSKQPNLGFIPEPAFSKNTAFNKNFGVIAGTVAEGNDSRILNGQTAFGWGNHASAGYALGNGSNASGNWAINITGRANDSSQWNGLLRTAGNLPTPTYFVTLNSDGSNAGNSTIPQIKSALGLSNAITGTGSTNFIPKFSAGGVLGNSQLINTSNLLEVRPNLSVGTDYFRLGTYAVNGLYGGYLKADYNYSNSLNTDLTLGVSNAGVPLDAIKILNNGNVGIGTTNPSVKLDVRGKFITANKDVVIGSIGSLLQIDQGEASGDSYSRIGAYSMGGTNPTSLILNSDGGNVIVGSTIDNGSRFQVNGEISSLFRLKLPGMLIGFWDSTNNRIESTGRPLAFTSYGFENDIKFGFDGTFDTFTLSQSTKSATFAGTVTAPTFVGNLNGNASSATNWGGYPANYSTVESNVPSYITGFYGGVSRVFNAPQIQSFLGLGSNAYSSGRLMDINGAYTGDVNTSDLNFAGKLYSSPSSSASPYGPFISFGSGQYTAQINADPVKNGNIFIRANGEGGVGDWRIIWHTGNFNPANYLPLTGGNLSGSLSASGFVRSIGTNPYYEFVNAVGSQMGYIQHNGANMLINSNNGGVTINNNTVINGSITASGGFFNSDKRLKDVINRDGNVAYFKWKDGRDDKTHIGYIAQEVQKTNPDQVIKGEDGILSVNYTEMLVLKVKSLENRVRELEGGRHGVC